MTSASSPPKITYLPLPQRKVSIELTHMNKKGFAHVTFLIIFLLAVLFVGAFVYIELKTSVWPAKFTQSETNPFQQQIAQPENIEKEDIETKEEKEPPKLRPEALEKSAQGRLLYIEDEEIFLINADRSGNKQLTDNEEFKWGMSVSPNGKLVAYEFTPSDESQRYPRRGAFGGWASGIGVYNFETESTNVLVPYRDVRLDHPSFSNDSNYLAVWIGYGNRIQIVRVSDGKVIFEKESESEKGISPIVWLSGNKFSYANNGNLVVRSLDDLDDRKLIQTNVDAYRPVHEGPNVAEPPLWSGNERYVTYYKNGDLYILDTQNSNEKLIKQGTASEMFNQTYPAAFPDSFVENDKYLVMLEGVPEGSTVILNVETLERQSVADFGSTLTTAPNKSKIYGLIDPSYANATNAYYNIGSDELVKCDTKVRHVFYWWAGGTDYQSKARVWSPYSTAIVGTRNRKMTSILLLDDCYMYDLLNFSTESTWMPN